MTSDIRSHDIGRIMPTDIWSRTPEFRGADDTNGADK